MSSNLVITQAFNQSLNSSPDQKDNIADREYILLQIVVKEVEVCLKAVVSE